MEINVTNLKVRYNDKIAAEVESLSFESGKIYTILGFNGSGKSTLINCIAGIEKFEGSITYNGGSIEGVRQGISIMVQKPYMFNTSVYENIGFGLKFRKADKKVIEEKVNEYEKYFGLGDILEKNAKTLSGGETSKVALIRCAVLETEVILLDEPTASMDIESTIKAENLIKKLKNPKKTIILITHDILQAERLSDYTIIMDKGKIIEEGEGNKVFKAPKHPHVKGMLGIRS